MLCTPCGACVKADPSLKTARYAPANDVKFVPPFATGSVPVTTAVVTSTAPVPSLVLVTEPNYNLPAVTFRSAISTS